MHNLAKLIELNKIRVCYTPTKERVHNHVIDVAKLGYNNILVPFNIGLVYLLVEISNYYLMWINLSIVDLMLASFMPAGVLENRCLISLILLFFF